MHAASNLFQWWRRNTLERTSEPAPRIVASEAVLDLVDEHLEGALLPLALSQAREAWQTHESALV
jgi:hypothetical protein